MPLAKAASTWSWPMNRTLASSACARAMPSGSATSATTPRATREIRMVASLVGRGRLAAERVRTGHGDGRVARRAGRAAHPDGPDDLPVHDDRLAAVERRRPDVEQRRAAADDGVLEDLGGLLEQGR